MTWIAIRMLTGDRQKIFGLLFGVAFSALLISQQLTIFINLIERGATAVAPWSLRARSGAPVAVPVTWGELAELKGAAMFSLANIDERLARPCPYLAQMRRLQTLDMDTATRLQDWIDD